MIIYLKFNIVLFVSYRNSIIFKVQNMFRAMRGSYIKRFFISLIKERKFYFLVHRAKLQV